MSVRLIEAFIPIWALTAIGYGARRRGLFDGAASNVLGSFVFYLAMPAALFVTMAGLPLSRIAWRSLAAFAISTAVITGVAWLGLSKVFDRKPADRPVLGMAAGYVNSANLGIPLATQVLGNISFLAQVVLLQTLVVTPVVLISLDRHRGGAERGQLKRIATLPLRNPVVMATGLGMAWSLARLPVPSPVHGSLSLLAGAAAPTALIALGASLSGEPALAAPTLQVSAITCLKLVGQPLVAYLAGLALHLTGTQLLTVVLVAGLPTAQNTFIFAQQYGIAEGLANRTVMVTSTLSLASLAAIVALLGPTGM
jgi:malonate transporter